MATPRDKQSQKDCAQQGHPSLPGPAQLAAPSWGAPVRPSEMYSSRVGARAFRSTAMGCQRRAPLGRRPVQSPNFNNAPSVSISPSQPNPLVRVPARRGFPAGRATSANAAMRAGLTQALLLLHGNLPDAPLGPGLLTAPRGTVPASESRLGPAAPASTPWIPTTTQTSKPTPPSRRW
jgi:hypothetical protein